MKEFIVSTLLIVLVHSGFSNNSDTTSNIYSGGMLIIQPGYSLASNSYQEIQNLNFGLGGILRFYFFDIFTAGIYGGTQRTKYDTENSKSSYLSIGYGGPFVGLSKRIGNFRYTASGFVGKGTIRNLHVQNQMGNQLVEASFYKTSTIVLSPILSVDYSLTQRLQLTVQAVCIMAKQENKEYLYNPTLQIGILFNR